MAPTHVWMLLDDPAAPLTRFLGNPRWPVQTSAVLRAAEMAMRNTRIRQRFIESTYNVSRALA